MSYTTYFEKKFNISEDTAKKLRDRLEKRGDLPSRMVTTRRARFQRFVTKETEGRYDICQLDFDNDQIYLEYKTTQDGRVYKRISPIALHQCIRMFLGDYEWMEESEDKLFREFYQYQKSTGAVLENIMETKKTVYHEEDEYISLKYSVKNIHFDMAGFFDPSLYMISCLDSGEVELSEKIQAKDSKVLKKALEGMDEQVKNKLIYMM